MVACPGAWRLAAAATAARAAPSCAAVLVRPAAVLLERRADCLLPQRRRAHIVRATPAVLSLDTLLLPHRSCRAESRRASGDVARPSAAWERAPKAWQSGEEASVAEYSEQDIISWRAEFGFSRRQHSLASFGYTDDELLEWRKKFDEWAHNNRIELEAFEQFVTRKYHGVIPEEELSTKVHFFWSKFDQDHNNFIDFGEFIVASFLFDVTWAKERIRQEGIEDTFRRYAADEFMAEPHMFELMCDFNFFVSTATDVHKLITAADYDRDGLVSLADFVAWVAFEDLELLAECHPASEDDSPVVHKQKNRGSAGKARKGVPSRPPAVPE